VIIFFVLCFIKTQPFVKRKKNTGTIAFRFSKVLLYKETKTNVDQEPSLDIILFLTIVSYLLISIRYCSVGVYNTLNVI